MQIWIRWKAINMHMYIGFKGILHFTFEQYTNLNTVILKDNMHFKRLRKHLKHLNLTLKPWIYINTLRYIAYKNHGYLIVTGIKTPYLFVLWRVITYLQISLWWIGHVELCMKFFDIDIKHVYVYKLCRMRNMYRWLLL